MPLSDVNEYADTTISQRISMVKGVAQVNLFGAQKRAVRIDVSPLALAARDLSLDELSSAVERANVNRPTGTPVFYLYMEAASQWIRGRRAAIYS
jgi:HAE1 family hydrophobic/amphiphilic exporter-1